MWRPGLVSWLLRQWRSLSAGLQHLSARAARRSSASALQRFTLAQSAAAIALVALTFALLVSRKLSMSSGQPGAESNGVAPFDAGAPPRPDMSDASEREPAKELPGPTRDR